MKIKLAAALLSLFIFSGMFHAQVKDSVKTAAPVQKDTLSKPKSASEPESKLKKFVKNNSFNFVLIGGYSAALSDSTDSNGGYVALPKDYSNNGFYLRYARFSGKFAVTPRIEAEFLVNLADFKASNVSTRVLESASATYKLNPFFNFRIGQFRPYYGIENLYAVQFQKSYYRSNTYLLMSNCNWQSFQQGASVYGSLSPLKIPLKYYFNVYNGNGKNKDLDDNKSKNFSTRLETDFSKNFILGLNFATSRLYGKQVGAFMADLQTSNPLGKHFTLNTESTFAYGNNTYDAQLHSATTDQVNDYKFRSFYILPMVQYALKTKNVDALEFSFRYENMYSNLSAEKNLRSTYTPMLSVLFAADYASKISVAAVIDDYDKHRIGTKLYHDSQFLVLQFQFKF